MISIIEQGFLRRNWGKLALGGGALAFAVSRGEEMPIAPKISNVVNTGDAPIKPPVPISKPPIDNPSLKPSIPNSKPNQYWNAALREKKPNVPLVKPSISDSKPNQYWNAASNKLNQYRDAASNKLNQYRDVAHSKLNQYKDVAHSKLNQYWNDTFKEKKPNVPFLKGNDNLNSNLV